MFGRKKKAEPQNTKAIEEIGRKIFVSVNERVSSYCSQVIYYAASGWLIPFAQEIEILGHGDPDDLELMGRKRACLDEFSNRTLELLQLFRQQLWQGIEKDYDFVFADPKRPNPGLTALALNLVESSILEQHRRIRQAASYIAGVAIDETDVD